MRLLVLLVLATAVSLAGCQNNFGSQRLALGVEVPCPRPAADMATLRGRTNAMERQERAALQQSLQLVDAAIALGGPTALGDMAKAVRQNLIDRSSENLKLAIETEADVACGFVAATPQQRNRLPVGPRTFPV